MKTSFSNKVFLCVAALAVAILGDTKTQAQPVSGGWTKDPQEYYGIQVNLP